MKKKEPAPLNRATWPNLAVAAGLMLLVLLFTFLLPADTLLSAPDTDLVQQFVASRAFYAHSLASGHIPLWNPYTYAGQPFLGEFESAVLYPLNLIFLLLPLSRALNFSLLIHLVILGWGMERWTSRRGLHPGAAALAGLIVPLSGAVFPHIYAGHLSNLCSMAWAPWIFLGLELWVMRGERRGLFLASATICLQLLAGHVQYFFFTAVAVALQALVLFIAQPVARWRSLPAVAGCYLGGMLLGAAQFLPGLVASTEGIRQKKLDYTFAAMFGFPPESFLGMIAPGFFGNLDLSLYWGRWYLWETSIYIGAASLALIAIACCDRQRQRQACLDLAVAGPLLILALGHHTPVFDLLYGYAPGFGHFRAWAKFIFPATLFLVLVAASGADFLLREKRPLPRVGWATLAAGLIAVLPGLYLLIIPESVGVLVHLVATSNETYLAARKLTDTDFLRQMGAQAGLSLALGGIALVATGIVLLLFGRWPGLRWAVPGLVVVEMIGFAAGQLTLSSLTETVPEGLRQFVGAHPGDYRVMNVGLSNDGFLLGKGDLWGDNPFVLRRYAEFMDFTQGLDPDHATQDLAVGQMSPLYALLRFQYGFEPLHGVWKSFASATPPLPHLLLVPGAKTLGGRDAVFSAMSDPQFDPTKTVLLELASDPAPQPDAVGVATLVSESPDELVIDAFTDKPTILLITDLYARDWRAEPLPGSVQQAYHLMPADYVLRAVPLQAGHHHLRIVYAPPSFPIGVAISIAAWALWFGLLFSKRWRST